MSLLTLCVRFDELFCVLIRRCADDGTEEFHINDFRIIQTGDGVVK